MADIHFLGTGGSVATPTRDNTAFLLRNGEDLILVDCPGSVIPKIKKLKFDPRRVRTILLSHTHPDHVYGLPSFVHSLMLEEGEVTLCASDESVSFSRVLLDIFHLRDSKIKTRIRFRPLAPGETTKLGRGLTARAIQVPHHSSSLAYHFCWEEDNTELVFSGDTPPSAPVFEAAQEVDFLIHDASAPARVFRQFPELHRMHTSALELGKWSQDAGVKCLIPCHFLGEIDFSPSEIRTEIRRSYKGKLIIPRDFEKIRLS
jgi:ribonuclease Z